MEDGCKLQSCYEAFQSSEGQKGQIFLQKCSLFILGNFLFYEYHRYVSGIFLPLLNVGFQLVIRIESVRIV